MKNKFSLAISIFQIIVGVLAVCAFFILGFAKENMVKSIGTLALAVAFIVLGVHGVLNYISGK
jgi:hypothetical protein